MFRDWLNENENAALPSVTTVRSFMPQLLQAAQHVYDQWEQDDEGYDEEYGGGGICHDIADAMSGVLSNHNIEAVTFSQSIDDVHVYVIAKFREGVYEINIPPYIYETGSGYTWKKIPGVRFQPNHVVIEQIFSDPNRFQDYEEGGY
jgi:hypothetical protein